MVRWLMVIMVMMVGGGAVWAQDVALSGKVVDSETSKGIENAAISLKSSPEISTVSSSDGSFNIKSNQISYTPRADLTRSLVLKNNKLVFSSGLLSDNTKVEIFSANGSKKATLKINNLSKTQNSIALPQLGSGLSFINIKSGNASYSGTLYSLGQKVFLTNVKFSGNSHGAVVKKEASINALADTLVVSKNGYSTKKYALESLVQNNITIEMKPVSVNGTKISLLTNSIEVDGSGATVNGTEVVITSAGTYNINGKLTDGKIVVRTEDKEDVVLVMNNVEVTNSKTSPLFVESAKNVIIELADGSENSFTDAAQYSEFFEDDEPNAAIFSKDDMTIRGGGKLTVKGNYNDAIVCKDGLTITDGNFVINSADDGIRGKDFLLITGGTFNINSSGDGLSSNDSGDVATGYISIQDGDFDITSAKDGIQAQNYIEISGGEFKITTGGGSSASASDDLSAKGIKATNRIEILGGTFTINSADDAIHSNALVNIKDGSFTIATGDDGVHADDSLIIAKANINITKSYEGLESLVMIINSGNVKVVSSDDGINIAGGTDGSGMGGGWGGGMGGGGGGFAATEGAHLQINGGNVTLYVNGDGLDSNGSIEITGGVVLVHGPASGGNGPLDHQGTFDINGGILIAAGTSSMSEPPSQTSTQNCIVAMMTSQKAGTLVNLQTSSGENILTFASAVSFGMIVISSPDLTSDRTYNLYYGGSVSGGTSNEGLYENEKYTAGTALGQNLSLSSRITQIGTGGGGGGGGGRW